MTKRLSGVHWTLILLCLLVCPLLVLSFVPIQDGNAPSRNALKMPQPALGSLGSMGSSRCFVDCSQLAKLGHLELHYSHPNGAWKDEFLLSRLRDPECSHLLLSTHELTVSGYGSLANRSSIASTLSLFSRLEALHWKNTHPIPASILSAMQKIHPDYRLYYELPLYKIDRYDEMGSGQRPLGKDTNNPAIPKKAYRHIINSKNLYSLAADVKYADGDAETMPLIHEILTTCPNLRELDLSLYYTGGCTPGWPHIYAFDFTNNKFVHAPFPPLEVLKLNGYDFDEPLRGMRYPNPWSGGARRDELLDPWHWILPNWFLDGVEPCYHPWFEWMCKDPEPPKWHPVSCPSNFSDVSNIDGWLKQMDFSSLRTLELGSPSSATLHKLAPVLADASNFTSLTINGGDICSAVELLPLLLSLSEPLHSLKLYNIRFPDLEPLMCGITSKDAGHLTSLSLHEHDELRKHSCYYAGPENEGDPSCATGEGAWWWKPRLYLNNSQLEHLSLSSPNIQNLDIDIDRDEKYSSMAEIFSTLSQFQKLQKLTLHIESVSIESIRNGSRQHYEPPDVAYRGGDIYDPLVNETWVEQVFNTIRKNQQNSPALDEMTIYVGRWETRHESSMMGPTTAIIGRYMCKLGTADESGAREKVQCSGGVQLPDYWGGSYAYGTPGEFEDMDDALDLES